MRGHRVSLGPVWTRMALEKRLGDRVQDARPLHGHPVGRASVLSPFSALRGSRTYPVCICDGVVKLDSDYSVSVVVHLVTNFLFLSKALRVLCLDVNGHVLFYMKIQSTHVS